MIRSKLLVGIMALVIAQLTFAKNNSLADYNRGVYVGGQVGYAETDFGSGPEDYMRRFPGATTSRGNIGGRMFVGYSLLPYLSLETGLTIYPHVRYSNNFQSYEYSSFGAQDLMVKGIFPLERLSTSLTGWNVYGKLGMAVVCIKDSNNDDRDYKVNPAYGLGIGYNFTDHFGVDLSWSGMYSNDKPSATDIKDVVLYKTSLNKAPSANIVALGFSYKF